MHIFSSPEQGVHRLGYCDHLSSVGVRPSNVSLSVHICFVYTLASTGINQSAPNLVKTT